LRRFLSALQQGDEGALLELLSFDVRLTTDSGGKVRAARNVIEGASRVVRFYLGLRRKAAFPTEHRLLELNGDLGFVSLKASVIQRTTQVECSARQIRAIYHVLNPDKLRALPGRKALDGLLSSASGAGAMV
jgi:RNA polymerase sigma-70 factor (ECF subfamily)